MQDTKRSFHDWVQRFVTKEAEADSGSAVPGIGVSAIINHMFTGMTTSRVARAMTTVLAAAAFVLCAATGCRQYAVFEYPVDSQAGYTFVVEKMTGERTDESVLSMPGFSFGVTAGDDVDYKVEYSLDGGAQVVKEPVRVGQKYPVEIASDALGAHVIEGKVYRVDGKGEVKTFKEEVWMRYPALTSTSGKASDGSGVFPFSVNGVIRLLGEDVPVIEVNYLPAYKDIRVEVEFEGPVRLAGDIDRSVPGRVTFPIAFTGEGVGLVRVILLNGDLTYTLEQGVENREPTGDDPKYRFTADFSVADFRADETGRMKVVYNGRDPEASPLTLTYAVDGGDAESVSPSFAEEGGRFVYWLNLPALGIGSHRIAATLSSRYCSDDGTVDFRVTGKHATDITITGNFNAIPVNGVAVGYITVTPADHTDGAPVATVGDSTIANAWLEGTTLKIRGLKSGTTSVTVSVGGVAASVPVVVI